MPDIREVLAALNPNDRALWSQHRTEMRRSYMAAHGTIVSVAKWDHHDDAFLDLIDIKLAILFDRAGKFTPTHNVLGDEAPETEKQIIESDAIKSIRAAQGWTSK